MAGLLGLLFLGGLFCDNVRNTVNNDIDSNAARQIALKNKEEIYYDSYCQPHWTETNELVDITRLGGQYKVIGLKSKKIYRNESSKSKAKEDKISQKYEQGLEYCKQHEIKYFPFYFPNSINERDGWANTGVEVQTNKKYCCLKRNDEYILLYLEKDTHQVWDETPGLYREYDAIHDKNELAFIDGYNLNTSKDKKGSKQWYLTKEYKISEEEYFARITPLANYPYEFYKLK